MKLLIMPLLVPSVLCCAGLLQKPDKSVLLVQRPLHKSMGGMWEFPGGKVDPGETPQETIVRELFEEIGIETSLEEVVPYTFVSHTYDPACAWVFPSELENYLVPSADEPIIKRLQNR